MAKVKTSFVCGECGYESARWYGKCPQCGSWNAMSEVEIAPRQEEAKRNRHAGDGAAQAYLIGDIPEEAAQRLSSGIGELDRVLGGGAVEGAVMLVGGDPGIGKSTLLTQASANMARAGIPVLYASGEESARQIKLRARRLGAEAAGILRAGGKRYGSRAARGAKAGRAHAGDRFHPDDAAAGHRQHAGQRDPGARNGHGPDSLCQAERLRRVFGGARHQGRFVGRARACSSTWWMWCSILRATASTSTACCAR